MRMVTQTTAIIVVLHSLVLILAGFPQVNIMKKFKINQIMDKQHKISEYILMGHDSNEK